MVDHKIELGNFYDGWQGQFVKIKPYRSWAEQQVVDAAGFAANMGQGDERVYMNADPKAKGISVVQAVTEWALTGMDGEPIPTPPDGFLSPALQPDMGNVIVDAIEDYYNSKRIPDDALKGGGAS